MNSQSNTKKRTPYTRLACQYCKEKHQKCDGNKPACMNCIKKNLECNYRQERNSIAQKRSAPLPPQEEVDYLRSKLFLWKRRYTQLRNWIETKFDQPIPSSLHPEPDSEEDTPDEKPCLKYKRPLSDAILPPLPSFSPLIPPHTQVFPSPFSPSYPFYYHSSRNMPGVFQTEKTMIKQENELSAFRGIGMNKGWLGEHEQQLDQEHMMNTDLLFPDKQVYSKMVPVLLVQKTEDR